jgi:hypothetical protein
LPQFGRRKDGIFGHRTAPREAVSLEVSLFTVDQSKVVILADISTTGAKVQGHTLPQEGQQVCLRLSREELFGRVVWTRSTECGITFDEPLQDDRLQSLIAELQWEPPQAMNTRRFYDLR